MSSSILVVISFCLIQKSLLQFITLLHIHMSYSSITRNLNITFLAILSDILSSRRSFYGGYRREQESPAMLRLIICSGRRVNEPSLQFMALQLHLAVSHQPMYNSRGDENRILFWRASWRCHRHDRGRV